MVVQSPVRTPESLRTIAGVIRRTVLTMCHASKSGHIGSAFSVTDILVALYCSYLRIDAARPRDPDRDRCILSKGHAAAALYAVLAERGFFPARLLEQYLQNGSDLPGHPSMLLPGIEIGTGSLGHGLGIGAGMALSGKQGGKTSRTVVVMSDGECDEGSVWEAALFAAHHGLENLVCIVDRNVIQGFGRTEDVLRLEPLAEKWRAFGWNAQEMDGHDHEELTAALARTETSNGKPHVLIATTVKGKGVSFMENTVDWHYWTMNDTQYAQALQELSQHPHQ